MRILHIVAGLPPEGGGLSELVPRMAEAEMRLGHLVTLVTRGGKSEGLALAAIEAEKAGVRLLRCSPSWPGFVFFSWQMLRDLRAIVRQADVVHVHGNWTFPVWWACRCALLEGKPLVMSPQGSFDPVRLRHSAWKKRAVGWLDRWCLRRAAAVHVTSEAERGWVGGYCDHRPEALTRPGRSGRKKKWHACDTHSGGASAGRWDSGIRAVFESAFTAARACRVDRHAGCAFERSLA